MRLVVFLLISIMSTIGFAGTIPLNLLTLPKGFVINLFAEVKGARELALGDKGTVFVGSADKVYAIVPDPKHPQAKNVLTIASGLNNPNGVAFHKGTLYVAEINRILKYNDIENHLKAPPKPVVVITLPDKAHHGPRFIAIGPDEKLYVGIGMPCNVCLSSDARFGTIMRMDLNGKHAEIYTKGVRNSMGFDWDPLTHQLWFTDNGRDELGDNTPPDKLNYAPTSGMNFGFPYYNGKDLPDPKFGKLAPPSLKFTPPTYALPAHVAALGMRFYTGKQFPAAYRKQIFIAEHGSWNRSSKVGYQVVVATVENNQIKKVKPFITGWLQDQRPWGRPVDVLVLPDGSLLISDDFAGLVYRVTYQR